MKRKLTKQKWYTDNEGKKKAIVYQYNENDLKVYAKDENEKSEVSSSDLKKQYKNKSYIRHKINKRNLPRISTNNKENKKIYDIFTTESKEEVLILKECLLEDEKINYEYIYEELKKIDPLPKGQRKSKMVNSKWVRFCEEIVNDEITQSDFINNIKYQSIRLDIQRIVYNYGFSPNKTEKENYEQMDRNINSSIKLSKSDGNKINRNNVYLQLLELKKQNIDEYNNLLKVAIEDKYKLEKLCNQIQNLQPNKRGKFSKKRNNKNIKINTVISTVKNHYFENVNNDDFNFYTDEEKLLLKIIHEFVKSRYRKHISRKNNQKKIQDLFTYEELYNKIERKINNKVLYFKNQTAIYKNYNINDNNMSKEEQEIAKQLLKANRTLRLKLADNIVDINATFAAKDIKEKNNDIISTSVNNLKAKYRDNLEKAFPDSEIYFYYAARLRNYTHHRQSITSKDFTKLVEHENFETIENDIEQYYEKLFELEKYQITTSKINNYYSDAEIQKVLPNDHRIKINYLPRFNKVFIRMMKLISKNWQFSEEESNQAQKMMFKLAYENGFLYEMNSVEKENYFKRNIQNLIIEKEDIGIDITNSKKVIKLENVSAIKEFILNYDVSIENLKEYKETMQKIPKDINAINRRIIDVITIMFINYINENELNNLFEDPLEKKDFSGEIKFNQREEIVLDFIKLPDIVQSVYSLHRFLPKNKINSLNNNLKKYIQYNESLIKKYGKNNVESVFNKMKSTFRFNGNLDEILQGFEVVIQLFTIIIKIPEYIDLASELDKGDFNIRLTESDIQDLKQYYALNQENSIAYKYEILDDKFKIINEEQIILNETNNTEVTKQQIYFKKLLSFNRFGENERFKDIHRSFVSNNKYIDILGKFGEYKSHNINGISEIESVYNGFNNNMLNLSENKKVSKQEIEKFNKQKNEYEYLKNMTYLTIIDKAQRFKYDFHVRLVSWMTEIEDWVYDNYRDEIRNFDENKSIIQQCLKKYCHKNNDIINDFNKVRNEIMHYKLNINDSKFNYNTIELFIKIKNIFKIISIKKYNDVENVFEKILSKYNISIETDCNISFKKYFNQNDYNKLKFVPKKHPKYLEYDLPLISEDEVDYLINVIKHKL